MTDPPFIQDLITNATAAAILAAVLYFGFRLLYRLIDLAQIYFERIDLRILQMIDILEKLTDAINHRQEKS